MIRRTRIELAALAACAVSALEGCTLVASLGDLNAGAGSGGAATTGAADGGAGSGGAGAGPAAGGGSGDGGAQGGGDAGSGGGATSGGGGGGSAAGAGGGGGAPIAPWSLRFGDSAVEQRATGVALDPDGNVIVAGTFEGSMQVGDETLVSTGDADVFVIKLGPDGAPIWARSVGGTARDRALGVAVDGAGDVVVGGDLQGSIAILGEVHASQGSGDVLVVKLGADGDVLWSVAFGSGAADAANGIAASADGNVVAVGIYAGTATLDTFTIPGASPPNLFAVGIQPDGTPSWLRGFGGDEWDYATDVVIAGDSAWISGTYENTTAFDGLNVVGSGDAEALILQLGPDGTALSANGIGGPGDQDTDGIGITDAGSVLFAMDFTGTVDLDPGVSLTATVEDAVMGSYDTTGALEWSLYASGPGNQLSRAIDLHPDGTMVWTGIFSTSITWEGQTVASAGNYDVFVAKLDAAGGLTWLRTYGSADSQQSEDVAIAADGAAIVAGGFEGVIDLGTGALTSAGGFDVFVARLAP
jgi:hypothetical protein